MLKFEKNSVAKRLNRSPITLLKRRIEPCLCWSQRVSTHLALMLTTLVWRTHWTWTFRHWLQQHTNTHLMQRVWPRLQFWTRSRYFTTALPKLDSFFYERVFKFCFVSVVERARSANFANTTARRLQVPRVVAEARNMLVGPKHISMHCFFLC